MSDAQALAGGLDDGVSRQRYYASSEVPASARRELAEAAKPRTAVGSDRQRLAALTLLAAASPDEAAEAAARLADDPKLGESLRTDAFQMQLLTQSGKRRGTAAWPRCKGTDARSQETRREVSGSRAAIGLRSLQSGFYLYMAIRVFVLRPAVRATARRSFPKPPEGVEVEARPPAAGRFRRRDGGLRRLSAGPARRARRHGAAAAVLARQQKSSSEWSKLVYRAIAVIDDPKYIPVLREIYGKLDKYERDEFYWTIRIMSGPEILKFRKQVRDEMGTPSPFEYTDRFAHAWRTVGCVRDAPQLITKHTSRWCVADAPYCFWNAHFPFVPGGICHVA